jgi:hypothetical protein
MEDMLSIIIPWFNKSLTLSEEDPLLFTTTGIGACLLFLLADSITSFSKSSASSEDICHKTVYKKNKSFVCTKLTGCIMGEAAGPREAGNPRNSSVCNWCGPFGGRSEVATGAGLVALRAGVGGCELSAPTPLPLSSLHWDARLVRWISSLIFSKFPSALE